MRGWVLSIVVLALFNSHAWAGEAEEARDKGLQALNESRTASDRVVDAARHFADAAELYSAAGDEHNAAEMNSFLYWCRKKMTLEEIERYRNAGNEKVVRRLESVDAAPPASEAKAWLTRAENFAAANPNEHYLVAVRYFEVASRFPGSAEATVAQERSLKEQGLSMGGAPTTSKAVVTAVAEHTKRAADPMFRDLEARRKTFDTDLAAARKAVFDLLARREADARQKGDKTAVDAVKLQRLDYVALGDRLPLELFSAENKRRMEADWKALAAAYQTTLKELVRKTRDADADSLTKEFDTATADWKILSASAPKNDKPATMKELAASTDGFAPLFNGRDFTGWYDYGGKASIWKIEGPVVICTGKDGGWMMSQKEYSDFVLKVEWRLFPGGDSGITFRFPGHGWPHYEGMELQIIDDDAPVWKNQKDDRYTGAIYDFVAPKVKALKPPGEWNTYVIVCRGPRVYVTLNGKEVQDFSMDEIDALSQRPRSGHIGFQSHTARVDFRNAIIKELK